MSLRFEDADMIDILSSDNPAQLMYFAKIDFPGETVRCHTGVGMKPFMGEDWQGLGELASVGDLQSSGTTTPESLDLSLVLDDAALFQIALNQNPMWREAEIYLVLLDDDGQVVKGGLLLGGYIVDYYLRKGTPYSVHLKVSDWLEFWAQPIEHAKVTNASQQHLHPGDRIYDQVEKLSKGLDNSIEVKGDDGQPPLMGG